MFKFSNLQSTYRSIHSNSFPIWYNEIRTFKLSQLYFNHHFTHIRLIIFNVLLIIIPTVQYAVPQRLVGTAFGFVGMFTNTAMTLFPLVAAKIVENSINQEQGYSFVASIVGLLFTISLYYLDTQNSIILDFINPESNTQTEQEILKSMECSYEEKMIEI
ncbi:unnamed protein product [Paramecium sonneborni]|uniref:Uncharacterized protein n=1 Tax=Paramecium sonneborni TaxID=65129 RepID=A0A8S1NU05_9CILI|nr:unnamed protein product [Paramecium sonneborni]